MSDQPTLPDSSEDPKALKPDAPAPAPAPDAGAAVAVRRPPTWVSTANFVPAGVAGAMAVGAAVVASVVVVLSTLLFAAMAGGLDTSSFGGSESALDGLSPVAVVVWLSVLGLFGQVVGALQVSSGLVSGTLQGYLAVVPVVTLISAVGAATWWSYRSERRRSGSAQGVVWALAGVSGLSAALLVVILSLIGTAAVAVPGAMGLGSELVVSSLSLMSFVGPFATITLAAAFGRWLARGPASLNFGSALWHAPNRFRWGTRDVYDYIAVVVVLFVPVGLVGVFFVGAGAPAVWPAGVGVITANAVALGHLGATTVSLSSPVPGTSTASSVSLFSPETNPAAWLLFVVALIAALLASVLIARRRQDAPVALQRAWAFPVLMLGAVLIIGLALSGGYVMGGAELSPVTVTFGASLALAWWTYALALVWGGIVEALARFVAPTLLVSFPVLTKLRVAAEANTWAVPDTTAPTTGSPVAAGVGVSGGSAPGVEGPSDSRSAGVDSVPLAAVPAQPLSPRARRGLLVGGIATAVLVVVGVGGAVAVNILQGTVFSPKTAASAYLEDIAAGRFADAWGADGASSITGGDSLITSNDVELMAAIESVKLGDPEGSGDYRTIPITYTLDGEVYASSLTMASSGKQFLVMDSWVIDAGLATAVPVSAQGIDELVIGGVPVAVTEEASSLISYPGVFDVTPTASQWVDVSAEPLIVSALGGFIDVTAEPSDALAVEVQRQVDTHIDECAATGEAEPEDCPFSLYSFSEVRGVVWTIDEYPVVEMNGLGSFSITESGKATASYEREAFFGDTWEADTSAESIYVSGEVSIDGDEVTLSTR